jgi:trk system potassium uptake protein TrkH
VVLDLRAVARTLGGLLLFLAVALLLPALVGWLYGEASWWTFLVTALLAGALGAGGWFGLGGAMPGSGDGDGRRGTERDLGIREGFAIVGLAWVVLALIGAVPFTLAGIVGYTDAFFETISGFTTTGATILGGETTPPIEALPNSFLFWRSLAHWMGGMGIIVLTLAILPILGVGGMQLFKAEVPGPSADKLTPRVRETAKRLWLIYVGITIVEMVLLLPAMSLFDAVNHAFATMATGGFSTENGSVGQYQSAYIDWVITVFMFLAGMNFALHFRMLSGKAINVFKDAEWRMYAAVTVGATAFITLATWRPVGWTLRAMGANVAFEGYASLADALRYAAFQSVAIITTTGFGTADYEVWPPLAITVVFLLFFCGGMAGSTGGGVKVIRHLLLFKNAYKEIKQLVHPRAVLTMRLNGNVVGDDVMRNVLSFIVLYIGIVAFGTLVMAVVGLDLLSAFGTTISCVGNVGPAFGNYGPTETYADIPAFGKWFLSLLMIAGRLEIFTILILFAPDFWRR